MPMSVFLHIALGPSPGHSPGHGQWSYIAFVHMLPMSMSMFIPYIAFVHMLPMSMSIYIAFVHVHPMYYMFIHPMSPCPCSFHHIYRPCPYIFIPSPGPCPGPCSSPGPEVAYGAFRPFFDFSNAPTIYTSLDSP